TIPSGTCRLWGRIVRLRHAGLRPFQNRLACLCSPVLATGVVWGKSTDWHTLAVESPADSPFMRHCPASWPLLETEAEMPTLDHRAATPADLDLIHRELMAVIDESPYYNAHFKAHEKGRLTKA